VGSSDFMTTYKYRETYNVVERARRQAKSWVCITARPSAQ
jgi:hypothetical protein